MGKENVSEKNAPAERLSAGEVSKLVEKYQSYGLREGTGNQMEYLVLPITEEDGSATEVVMHKFKKLGGTPIEERIREHLKIE